MHRIELIGLEKKYREKTAVQCVDFCFESGVYGLLGENGAGKTTLLRMISGIAEPTKGEVRCDGIGIRRLGKEYRALLGYLPQEFGYYRDFTAVRFLRYMAALKALPKKRAEQKIEELLDIVGLAPYKKQKLKTYSGGMIRRLGITQALLNDPEILILDEPTAGLDPKERVRFRNIISSLGKERTVLLSTHIVSDVDYIADQILMMKEGKIICSGSQEELAAAAGQIAWICIVPQEKAEKLSEKYIVSNLKNRGSEVELRIVSDQKPAPDAAPAGPALEDIYLYLTGNVTESLCAGSAGSMRADTGADTGADTRGDMSGGEE